MEKRGSLKAYYILAAAMAVLFAFLILADNFLGNAQVANGVENEASGSLAVSESNYSVEEKKYSFHYIDEFGRSQSFDLVEEFGINSFTLESPLIPIAQLAEATKTPVCWEENEFGYALVWAGRDTGTIFFQDNSHVVQVKYLNEPTKLEIVATEVLERSFLLDDTFCVPISALDLLGINYEIDAEARTVTMTDIVKASGSSAETIWKLAKNDVEKLLEPTSFLLASGSSYMDLSNPLKVNDYFLALDQLHGTVIPAGEYIAFSQVIGGIYPTGSPLPQFSDASQVEFCYYNGDYYLCNNNDEDLYLVSSIKGSLMTLEAWLGEFPQSLPSIMQPTY